MIGLGNDFYPPTPLPILPILPISVKCQSKTIASALILCKN
ncbi:hypothetical protein HPHPH4_0208 [Helicobacter pylori Hp H-4]|nr:hypothetical protein HPHPH4_0208 [Helicobacter pylori Hp H-4]